MSNHNDTFLVTLLYTNIRHAYSPQRGLCCGCSIKWLTVTPYPRPLGWFHSNVPSAFEGGRNVCSLNELSVLGMFSLRNKHSCTRIQRLCVNKCKTCNVGFYWPFFMFWLLASHFQQCLISFDMFMHVHIFVCGLVFACFGPWTES